MHRHRWVKAREHFNPPQTSVGEVSRISEDALMSMVYGFTVVTYRCVRCPLERHDTVTGRVSADD